MKILVINSGSSSVKYKLIDTTTEQTLAEGGVEKIGLADGFLKYKRKDGSKAILDSPTTRVLSRPSSTCSPIPTKAASRAMTRLMP